MMTTTTRTRNSTKVIINISSSRILKGFLAFSSVMWLSMVAPKSCDGFSFWPSSSSSSSSVSVTRPIDQIISPTPAKKKSRLLSPPSKSSSLEGIRIQPINGGPEIELVDYLKTSKSNSKSLFIFGTYAADFNTIEYAQRLRYYLPQLKDELNVSKFGFLLNCEPDAARTLAELVDLDQSNVDLFVDNTGKAGKQWGVGRGWQPDNDEIVPFVKLFGMLWGLGAWATLPAVISGYVGNPFIPQPWIEDAFAVGMKKNRWPDNALEIDDVGQVVKNKFSELPIVGKWARRPLELATLRLQSMIGISLKEWDKLAPNQESLDEGVLTQLGGLIVVDGATGDDVIYQWKDPGICAVANFEDIIKALKRGG